MKRICIGASVVLSLGLLASPAHSGWLTFGEAEGMPNDKVSCIHEDRHGYLWFSSLGITRFDGVNWTSYNSEIRELASWGLVDICETRSGDLWFAIIGGAAKFDGNEWTVYTTDDGLANWIVNTVYEDQQGNMWFGTAGGISRFDGATWTTYSTGDGLAGNNVRSIIQDSPGDLWFGTTSGASRYDGATWTTYRVAEGLPDDNVRDIIEDSSGNLWFGTFDGGVSRFDGSSWRTYDVEHGLTGNRVQAICEDHLGYIWLGTDVGVSRYDGMDWKTYTTSDGLGADDVRAIIEDSSGAMWFGTSGGGASRYDRVEWGAYTMDDGLAYNVVFDITQDTAGDMWFGTGGYAGLGGASRFDGTAWTSYTPDDGLSDWMVWSICQDTTGGMWFGTDEGVSSYGGAGWYNPRWPDGPPPNAAYDVYTDSAGDVWVASVTGLFIYDGQGWSYFYDDIVERRIFSSILETRDGRMWFGTHGGLKMYDGTSWALYSTEAGLPDSLVSALAEDNYGNIWVGSAPTGVNRGGLCRFDGSSWVNYTIADGLADEQVNSIIEDRTGVMWFGTMDGGISLYKDGIWGHLTANDGLLSNDIRCLFEDNSGRIWIGYDERCGVSYHEPDRVSPQTVLLLKPPALSSSNMQSVGYDVRFEKDSSVTYSYSIDSSPWSQWSPQTFWTGNVGADGTHTFAVRARDMMGNVDPTPAVCTFEIDATPPLAVISSPLYGQPVRDTVLIRGTADDARFENYRLDFRTAGGQAWTPFYESDTHEDDGVLAAWNTTGLEDGDYELQLSVTDTLGLTGTVVIEVIVDNAAPWAYETSPAVVKGSTGGDIYSRRGDVHLYFPPHCFETESEVRIDELGEGDVPDTLAGGVISLGKGYEIAWDGALVKAGTLELSYGESRKPWPEGTFALYTRGADSTWSRLGGTNDSSTLKISSLLTEPGLYLLFVEAEGVSVGGPLSGLTITPRVFSPAGDFAAPQAAIGFTLGRPGPVTVKIYNRAGRLINEVISGKQLTAGANLVHWDGRGREGDLVDDGIYLVTVEALGRKQVKPLAVVR